MDSEATNVKIPGSGSRTSSDVPLRDLPAKMQTSAMERLWLRMSGVYGVARWREHAPAEMIPTWLDILGGQTLAGIARGIGRYEADPGKFPPGAADFRRACAEFQAGTFSGGVVRQDAGRLPAIQNLKPRTAVGRRWMAYMRLRGLIPMGAHTPDDLERDLDGADLDAMDETVARETEVIRRLA